MPLCRGSISDTLGILIYCKIGATMNKDLGHGTTALLLLVTSYIVLGVAIVSIINGISSAICTPGATNTVNTAYLNGVLFFIALLLWMFALYTAGLGRGKDENKFMAAFTSYCAFLPVIIAFAFYITGISPLEVIDAFAPTVKTTPVSVSGSGFSPCR